MFKEIIKSMIEHAESQREAVEWTRLLATFLKLNIDDPETLPDHLYELFLEQLILAGVVGSSEIEDEIGKLLVNEHIVQLSRQEYQVFTYLFQHQGQPMSCEDIAAYLQQLGYKVSPLSIRDIIKRVREKIEENLDKPQILLMVFKKGYMVAPGVDVRKASYDIIQAS